MSTEPLDLGELQSTLDAGRGIPTRTIDALIAEVRRLRATEAAVRALCEQAAPRHDQYDFAQAILRELPS